MTDKQIFFMAHDEARRRAMDAVSKAPAGFKVTISPPTRTLDANAALWRILTLFSEQMLWPVNGNMVRMEPEEWKAVLSAGFRQEQARLAMGLNGGVVMLGLRTSKMSKREFSEFLEFLHAVAADRGVDLQERVEAHA
jgi:hypothetical protein